MRKLLNKPWVVALLAVAAIVFVVQSLREKRPVRPRASVPEVVADNNSEEPGETTQAPVSLEAAIAGLAFPNEIPDPFAPRTQRVSATEPDAVERPPDIVETLRLSAIWQQGGTTYLLLNGRICRPGDVIGRVTVESADRTGVWLSHWKGRDFITIGNDFTLITPASEAANTRTAHHEG